MHSKLISVSSILTNIAVEPYVSDSNSVISTKYVWKLFKMLNCAFLNAVQAQQFKLCVRSHQSVCPLPILQYSFIQNTLDIVNLACAHQCIQNGGSNRVWVQNRSEQSHDAHHDDSISCCPRDYRWTVAQEISMS